MKLNTCIKKLRCLSEHFGINSLSYNFKFIPTSNSVSVCNMIADSSSNMFYSSA